jgi:hypothetical protein
MASSLQSCIKYRHSLKQTVSDINVTEIFIKHNGQTDEDAIVFWTQLMAVTGLKEHMEAIFQSSFKKGWSKDQRKMVQQIALSKYSQVTSEFIEYVSQSIRRNESLWSLRRISFPKAKDSLLSRPVPFQSPTVASTTISEPLAPTKVATEKETIFKASNESRQCP